MRARLRLGFMAALALAGGEASAAGPIERTWAFGVRMPYDKPLAYRGVSSLDAAGLGTASILYPAPNVAGLLAAVLAHSAISDTAQKAEKERLQQEADKVLAPYREVLKDFDHRQLAERSLARSKHVKATLLDGAASGAGQAVIEAAPVFSMTQDQTALIVDNTIAIVGPQGGEPVYRKTVRVVGRARAATDLAAFWTAERGEPLKDESARLFALSLELALGEAAGEFAAADAPQRTVRYHEGSQQKIERAHILRQVCGRTLIRTLRESLMSVPGKKDEATPDADCAAAVLD